MSRPGSNGSAYQQGSDGYGGGAGAAHTWDKERPVIAKAEVTEKGKNPRFVLTSLKGDAQRLYEQGYCGRGEMENRIKEQQFGLFADRTSCHCWWANQFRLLLSASAFVLLESIRRVGLEGTWSFARHR
jgi:hypothetical protein